MKIYTKTGDKGETGYIGGRIPKNSLLIHSVGELDELNASLGLASSQLADNLPIKTSLNQAQNNLFELGGIVANPKLEKSKQQKLMNVLQEEISNLEKSIDQLSMKLPELQNFILPGGSLAGSSLHLARSGCRRAERAYAALLENPPVSYLDTGLVKLGLIYLNRLSDWLFVAARWVNQRDEKPERLWHQAT